MQTSTRRSSTSTRMPSGAQARGRGVRTVSTASMRLLAVGCLAGGMALAQAQTATQSMGSGFYAGGSIGSAHRADGSPISSPIDKSDTGYKLYGGYEFHPNFAVEAGYANLGKFSGAAGSVKSQGAYADLVGKLPLVDRLSALGRVGIYDGHTTVRDSAGPSGKDHDGNLKYGAGLQYDLTPTAAIRAEWERYRLGVVDDRTNVNLYTVGANFRF